MQAAIVGIGHDLQAVAELAGRDALTAPEVLFTEFELSNAQQAPIPERALAVLFSAKEAFFKAIPVQRGWLWSELELRRDEQGRPHFCFRGALAELMAAQHWLAHVSVSHSGAYVSTFVLLQAAES